MLQNVGLVMLTDMTMKNTFFWVVTLKFEQSLKFRRNIHTPFSGLKSRPVRNQQEAGCKQRNISPIFRVKK
jgi:hypothetical protein